MKHLHLWSRLATTGLLVVLLVLISCSIGAATIIWSMSNQAEEANHMNDLYQQAYSLTSTQDSIVDEYDLNPGKEQWSEYQSTASKLVIALQEIHQQGDSRDRAFVDPVLKEQSLYSMRAEYFFQLIDRQQVTQGRSFYNKSVDSLASDLSAQLQSATNSDHQIAAQSLANLRTTQEVIFVSLALVFLFGTILLALCMRIINRYKRELVQAELRHLEQVGNTDPLTGLLNHRVVIERLETMVVSSQHQQQSCALVFVDLDHFKQINDRWGHQAGDAVLREVGKRLRLHLRPEDVVGRYGGEEFVIGLPQTDLHQAEQLAERLRTAITDQPCLIPAEKENASPNGLRVTASLGVALFPEHASTLAALLEAADSAMYQAKHSGRNQVWVANDTILKMKDVLTDGEMPPLREMMTLQALTAAATVHDGGTSTHAQRLVGFAGAIAYRMHCSPEECHLVRLAAVLHDIGKIGIPDAVLHKPGPLTDDEWTIMRQHPVLGQQLLKQVGGIFAEISHSVVAHHERWDGRGYPLGLSKQAIPLAARILAVVDAYDAMISLRVYRLPLSEAEARTELLRCAGSQFDPQVVDAFLEEMDEEKQLQQKGEIPSEASGQVA
jgi:diguanylate cyclase (GGDEF)-like protein